MPSDLEKPLARVKELAGDASEKLKKGAGVARSGLAEAGQAVEQGLEQGKAIAKARYSEASDAVKQGAAAARQRYAEAGEALEVGKDKASKALKTGKERAGAAYDKSLYVAQDVADKGNRMIQENPLTTVAAALAVGALLGGLLPKRAKKALAAVSPFGVSDDAESRAAQDEDAEEVAKEAES